MGTICIETDKPVAYDSPDHLEPWGTARDNSVNRRFNRKLFAYLPAAGLKVLDVGCSGGGFVKSVLDRGGFAVGIEGSDYSKRHRRAEWATIPGHLFTADVTEPFQLSLEGSSGREPLRFGVITAWEVFEHIAEDRLPAVIENLLRHLAPRGILIASIAPYDDIVNGVQLHQTVQERPWWIDRLGRLGLEHRPAIERYFHFDWVRGGPGKPSFVLAMTRKGEDIPAPGRLRMLTALHVPYEALRSLWSWIKQQRQKQRAADPSLGTA